MLLKEKLRALLAAGDHPFMASQEAVSLPIIARMCKKMEKGVIFESIQTADAIIINGHHRYLAARLTKTDIEDIPWVKAEAKEPRSWNLVEIRELDYDQPEDIAAHNAKDAKIMNMNLEQFLEFIS